MNDIAKKQVAQRAADMVKDDMVIGLGTGSTARFLIDELGARVASGLSIRAIATSLESERQAIAAGIELLIPDETTRIDLAIDGADEIDPDGHLIKGGGAALLREKIVATAADHFVVIADQSKDVPHLGAFPLPIEIDAFGWALTVSALRRELSALGFGDVDLQLRASGPGDGFLTTDGGHYVVDARLVRIIDPAIVDQTLTAVPGVVTTGLFVGVADTILIGTPSGVEQRKVT